MYVTRFGIRQRILKDGPVARFCSGVESVLQHQFFGDILHLLALDTET